MRYYELSYQLRKASLRTSPRSWLLEKFDALFLPGAAQGLAPDDLSRSRVVAIAASAMLLVDVSFLLSLPGEFPPEQARTLLVITIIVMMAYTSVLVLLRTLSTPRLPSLLLCLVMTAGYIGANVSFHNPSGASNVISPVLTLMAFFLLGARGGFFFAAAMSLYTLISQPSGVSPSDTLTGGARLPAEQLFSALCIMGVWGLSYLHSQARDKAQAALEQTLKSLREGERKLSSLVESTDDVVCSLDTQGHLLTANSRMLRWFTELTGQQVRLGEPITTPRFLERHPDWQELFSQALRGERVRQEVSYPQGETSTALDLSLTPIAGESGAPTGVTVFGRDITARRQAEARLGDLHRTLLETSRKAGMAEIATGVLHNVGNTLNSVNVSAMAVATRLRGLRVPGLLRATEMMKQHSEDLTSFLTHDDKGRRLPEYLESAARQLSDDQSAMLEELQSLTKNVEHIKTVVGMQQEHARVVSVVESVALPELLDDALRLHANSFERLGIQVRREYAPVPRIMVDRHKLLQIVVNLLSNARHALMDCPRPDKQLTLRIIPHGEGRLRIEVADNGVGILPENLARMFTHGFTTKKDGHGFGLHISALTATEMQGSLTCSSAGSGQGATFTIDLPLNHEQAHG
jgi:two-component system, LuxR family, sensor kinase FixL